MRRFFVLPRARVSTGASHFANKSLPALSTTKSGFSNDRSTFWNSFNSPSLLEFTRQEHANSFSSSPVSSSSSSSPSSSSIHFTQQTSDVEANNQNKISTAVNEAVIDKKQTFQVEQFSLFLQGLPCKTHPGGEARQPQSVYAELAQDIVVIYQISFPAAEAQEETMRNAIASRCISSHAFLNSRFMFRMNIIGGITRFIPVNRGHNGSRNRFSDYLLANYNSILKDLFTFVTPARTIGYIVEQQSKINFADNMHQPLKHFYQDKTILLMPSDLAKKTSQRFVAPGGLGPVPSDSMLVPIHGNGVQSKTANVIAGWSGGGKTTFATLPISKSKNINTLSPKLVCAVLTPDGLNVNRVPFCTCAKLEEFQNDDNIAARDNAAAVMFALSFIGLVGGKSIEVPVIGDVLKTERVALKLPNSPDVVLVPNCDALFGPDMVSKVREALEIDDALPEGYEFRFVIDEAGSRPALIRSFCRIWNPVLRPLMQKLFNISNINNICLCIVGTGAEYVNLTSDVGTLPQYFTVSNVNSSHLFRDLLNDSIIVSNSNKGHDFLVDLRNTLYGSAKAATTPSWRLGTQNARNFSQLVSDNARCAALAISQILKLVENGYFLRSVNPRKRDLPFIEKLSSLLDVWSMHICNEFIRLNSLTLTNHPYFEIGRALKVVMSRRTALTKQERFELIVVYGLLFDTAKKGPALVPTWDKTRPRYRIPQSIVSAYLFRKNLGCTYQGGSDDAFEQMVADHHALCLALHSTEENSTPTSSTLLDSASDSQLLSYRMFEAVQLTKPIIRINLHDQLVDGKMKDDKAEKIKNGTEAPEKSKSFSKLEESWETEWKKHIREGGAIVIVNGPKASFADVIVLTAGTVFLTQCKHLEPKAKFTKVSADEEFEKMLFSPRSIFTRQFLVRCCSAKEATCAGFDQVHEVKFVASLVFFARTQDMPTHEEPPATRSDTKATEGFEERTLSWQSLTEVVKFKKQYIYSFLSGNAPNQAATPSLGLADDGTASSLYPIVTGAIDGDHLLNARKGATAWEVELLGNEM